MRSERVAVILVEVQNVSPGKPTIRLFDVMQRLETVKNETDGTERPRVIWEIVTEQHQPARADGGMLRFREEGHDQESTARPRVFLAVRSTVQRELQTLLGGIHGFCS